jgi:hypothetical protein
MASFRFADILLTLVVLLITFAILFLVERTRSKNRKKKEEAGFNTDKNSLDN